MKMSGKQGYIVVKIILPIILIIFFLVGNIDSIFSKNELVKRDLLKEEFKKNFIGKIINISNLRNRPSVRKIILNTGETYNLFRSIENDFELNDSVVKKRNTYEIKIYKSEKLKKVIYLDEISEFK